MRIILVEDNPADVFLIEEALRAHEVSFEITWVRNGEQAIALIDRGETNNPELFLLDLNLPRVDGRDILAKIRRTPGLAKIPVIIMTSSDSPQDRRETAKLGATCYIKKPPTLDEFIMVGEIIGNVVTASVASS
jgi:two-component system, chemotaxis family, response regulator Rcp1